ncbi:hypothetical protein H7170_04385 [Candidatus Gracilibacteria bacterium]|nr:hypothetical protein [Candidatus Gracilibacteria bacterium]
MNNTTLHITTDMSQMAALKEISREYRSHPGFLTIDLSDATFSLSRDFFLVLTRRLPSDIYRLILPDAPSSLIANSLGIQTDLAGVHAEFDRQYGAKDITTHNMSMLAYLTYELRRGIQYLYFLAFEKTDAKKKIIHIKKNGSHFALIIIGLIMSMTLLLFIFHFAVSKTIITITPQISIRPISANIVYIQGLSGSLLTTRNTLPLREVDIPTTYTMRFQLETVDPNSTSNARGIITVYNETSTAQALKPQTRFVTLDGVVFRSVNWVNVPPAKSLNGITEMGTIDVEIVSDVRDEAGTLIGQKGNIQSGVDLTIPGLKFNRDKIYAKSKIAFVGGEAPRIHIVTEAEVTKFTGLLKEQLHRVARNTLQKNLDDKKVSSGDDYALFSGDAVAFTGETYEIISGQKYGEFAEEIEMRGTVLVKALTYDRKATIDYLTSIFREGLLAGTDHEVAVHADTLRVSSVISRSPDDMTIKATMEMNTSIAHDFEDPKNQLTHYLKVTIAGLAKTEAITRLLNTGHVKEVTINSYPFWNRSVSGNIDQIEFVIKK